ncbi:hypothetical protein E4K63_04190 [Allofrancisella inopinata]|uniref:Uncharacterized protein n=1 Tax=Allofrancisella inopinata TaxID=1085647 RepID=A0AAE6YHK4_9GAMM|nr:hypothetical protein E4K63_04190 [Allofrancisella inopinata]
MMLYDFNSSHYFVYLYYGSDIFNCLFSYSISHYYIRKLQINLNNKTKKCLIYLTPNEVLFWNRYKH